MKILKVVHCFPPDSMSGSEIYAYNLAQELSKDHEVRIFYRTKNPKKRNHELEISSYNGLKLYKINNTLRRYNSLEKIYYNSEIEKKLEHVLDEFKPDVVHIHHLLFLSLGIVDIIKSKNIPIVFTLHDYWLMCPRGQLLKANLRICKDPSSSNCLLCLLAGLRPSNLIKKILTLQVPRKISKRHGVDIKSFFKKIDLFIAPSEYLKKRFIGWGLDRGKIMYSDHGMNTGLFVDSKKIPSDKIRIGFIGTLIPAKGAHILIKAFKRLEKDRALLKIYGHSPINNGIFDFNHRIRFMARGRNDISFMGKFDNKDIENIFKEIDLLVFPSLWEENSPLILREAILSGTPVLTSNIGGVSEIIHDKKYLFKPGDSDELFHKIKELTVNRNTLRPPEYNPSLIKDIKSNAQEMNGIYHKLVCQP
ncbi:MAG: glycosyltransferase family 4 protein [Candidatus Omnitrophota bacterium]